MIGKTCQSCGAPIIWAVTDRGRSMPVDRDPVRGGTVKLDQHSGSASRRARVVTARLAFGRTDLHMPHHATCPHGKAWKRKRGAGRG